MGPEFIRVIVNEVSESDVIIDDRFYRDDSDQLRFCLEEEMEAAILLGDDYSTPFDGIDLSKVVLYGKDISEYLHKTASLDSATFDIEGKLNLIFGVYPTND